MNQFTGKRLPDLFVMGNGIWPITFANMEHKKMLHEYSKNVTQFKTVSLIWKIKS
jgi:hypothetical protein